MDIVKCLRLIFILCMKFEICVFNHGFHLAIIFNHGNCIISQLNRTHPKKITMLLCELNFHVLCSLFSVHVLCACCMRMCIASSEPHCKRMDIVKCLRLIFILCMKFSIRVFIWQLFLIMEIVLFTHLNRKPPKLQCYFANCYFSFLASRFAE